MESQNHNLLVVSLESNCVTSVDSIGKACSGNNTSPMSANMEAPLLQLSTPIHCLGAAVSRLPSDAAHLQPLQAVSFDSTQQIQQHTSLLTNNAIYQPLTADVIHLFTPSQQLPENNNYSYLSASSVTTLHIPSQTISSHPSSSPNETTVETSCIDIIDKSQNVERSPSTIPSELAFPDDDFEYYEEIKLFLISKQLPSNKSETYQSRLTERSKHYMVKNRKLYHNVHKPREVVMKKEHQLELLRNAHVLKDTGVHVGVRKMFNKLKSKYFWRGMYTDIVSFTKNCVKCSEAADVGYQKKQEIHEDCEDLAEYDPASVTRRSIGTQCADSWGVWRKVELQLHDSLPNTSTGNNRLVTITDPISCWVVAKAVPADIKESSLATLISHFIFEAFCTFGFTRCCFVRLSYNMKDCIAKELDSKIENASKLYLDSIIEEKESKCKWIVQLVSDLVRRHPEWDQNLNNFLFDHRTGNFWNDDETSPFSYIFNHSPFLASTIELHLETDENKENIVDDGNSSSTNRRAPDIAMKCSFCEEVFTSKISRHTHEQIHCSTLPVNTEKTKSLERRIRSKKSELMKVKGTSSSTHPPSTSTADVTCPTSEVNNVCMESTVSAVKALLEATREERRKRGKYQKFPPELQKQMAKYGIKHGYLKAAKFFTVQLGKEVSVRTIRTVMNLHSNFNPKVSEEIGRFAARSGIEQASRYFSEKFKRNISLALVRKFQKMFLEKFPNCNRKYSNLKRKAQTVQQEKQCSSSKRILDSNLEEMIGQYASRHTINETIKHFTPKLQNNIGEGMIKKCLNIFVNKVEAKTGSSNAENHENCIRSQSECVSTCSSRTLFETVASSESISRIASETQSVPELSVSVETDTDLNSNQDRLSSQIVDKKSSPATVIVTQTDHNPCLNSAQNIFNSQHADAIPYVATSSPRVPFTAGKQSQMSCSSSHYDPDETKTIIDGVNGLNSTVPDSFTVDSFQVQFDKNGILIPLDNSTNEYTSDENKIVKQDHDYSNTINRMNLNTQNCFKNSKGSDSGDCLDTQDDSNSIGFNDDVESSSLGNSVLKHERIEANLDGDSSSSSCSSEKVGYKAKVKKGASGTIKKDKKKRGSYTAYSPELRADIGRYAAEHGCFEARLHFQNVLGHMIPESTMRGLRDKYLNKQAHCKVTSLGYSQRGRPLRLGKYDEIVQQSLKQLIRSGERASSFVVIATAKQILNSAEPELLEENGGPIKLNTTWAKSFLKRIGVHNNS